MSQSIPLDCDLVQLYIPKAKTFCVPYFFISSICLFIYTLPLLLPTPQKIWGCLTHVRNAKNVLNTFTNEKTETQKD